MIRSIAGKPLVDEDDKYDRKNLFALGAKWLGNLIAEKVEKRLDFVPRTTLRPPGALVESLFLSTCDGSAKCAAACPYGSIRMMGPPAAHAEVTPAITPTAVACYLCVDMPCAKACPSGALVPTARTEVKMGLAVVKPDACFAWQGAECASCSDACPIGKKAIYREGRGPVVSESACTGCGVCTNVCPARPRAIRIKPL